MGRYSILSLEELTLLKWPYYSKQSTDLMWSRSNYQGFPGGSVVKNLPANAGDTGILGSIHGLARLSGGGNGTPLQYSCQDAHGQRGLGSYSPWGHRAGHTWVTEHAHYQVTRDIFHGRWACASYYTQTEQQVTLRSTGNHSQLSYDKTIMEESIKGCVTESLAAQQKLTHHKPTIYFNKIKKKERFVLCSLNLDLCFHRKHQGLSLGRGFNLLSVLHPEQGDWKLCPLSIQMVFRMINTTYMGLETGLGASAIIEANHFSLSDLNCKMGSMMTEGSNGVNTDRQRRTRS